MKHKIPIEKFELLGKDPEASSGLVKSEIL
jgi:hypothetical protein